MFRSWLPEVHFLRFHPGSLNRRRMRLRCLFQNNPGPHFLLLPVPSAHPSVHPMLLLQPYTLHPSDRFFPEHRLSLSNLPPHSLLSDHLLFLWSPLFLPHFHQNILLLLMCWLRKRPVELWVIFSSFWISSFLFCRSPDNAYNKKEVPFPYRR